MAWIAALIGGGLGIGGSLLSKDSADKAAKNAGKIDSKGYKAALAANLPYQDVGTKGLYSLAQLMGLDGYRTPEETAYTNFLKTAPNIKDYAVGGVKESDLQKLINAHPVNALTGTGAAGLGQIAGSGLEIGPIPIPGATLIGNRIGGSFDDRAAMDAHYARKRYLAKLNAANAKYQNDINEWNARKAELLGASNNSLQNYDPNAALRSRPGYTSRYDEGLNTALNNMAGARKSGNALRGLTEFGQNFASNEFNNEYNRLAGLAGIGQNATTTSGNWAIRQAGNQAQIQQQLGQNAQNYYGNLNNVAQGTLNNYLNYRNRQNQPQVAYDLSY